MEVLVLQKKSSVLILVKQRQYFAYVCITMVIRVICLLKEIYMFKANNISVNFPPHVSLGSISNKFSYTEAEEVSLKGSVYELSIAYRDIAVDNILDIH